MLPTDVLVVLLLVLTSTHKINPAVFALSLLKGYPKAFAVRAGLIDCKLGGTEGNIKAGSDNDYSEGTNEEEDQEEVPIADQETPIKTKPHRVTPAKSSNNKKKSNHPFDLAEISEKLEDIYLSTGEEEDEKTDMQIITVVKTDVTVKGFAPVKYQDLLVMQALLLGGAVVSSIRVEIDRENPNEGILSLEQDPHLLVGFRRVKKEWRTGNHKLSDDIEALFDVYCKEKLALEGSTPPHIKVDEKFQWPNELKSQLNPVDPFVLGFRAKPSQPGQTLFETKTIKTKTREGKVVPAMLLSAFFFVEKHTHVNNMAGSGLRVDLAASDSDTEGSISPMNRGFGGNRSKKRRKSSLSEDDSSSAAVNTTTKSTINIPMDTDDDRKKPPPSYSKVRR
jgi:hypothetical protein